MSDLDDITERMAQLTGQFEDLAMLTVEMHIPRGVSPERLLQRRSNAEAAAIEVQAAIAMFETLAT